MKRKYIDDGGIKDGSNSSRFHLPHDVPVDGDDVIVETSPPILYHDDETEDDIDVIDETEVQIDLNNRIIQKNNEKFMGRACALRNVMMKNEVDIADIGQHIIYGVVEKSLETKHIEREYRNSACSLISISELVNSIMLDECDPRFGMVGQSMMWNTLRSNVLDLKRHINSSMSTSINRPIFHNVDLNFGNLMRRKSYIIHPRAQFVKVDLVYILSSLIFKENAKLINKAKQFIKSYLMMSCKPRWFIWRYTIRKSGCSHKKTILDMPQDIVDCIVEFLLDCSGIPIEGTSLFDLNCATPYYRSLGFCDNERRDEHARLVSLRESLKIYFRDCILDCLNEIREMPYNISENCFANAPRGRKLSPSAVSWRQYEQVLRREQENPTPENIQYRQIFEDSIRTD